MANVSAVIDRLYDVLTDMVEGNQPTLLAYGKHTEHVDSLSQKERADLQVVDQLERFSDYDTLVEQPGSYFKLKTGPYGYTKSSGDKTELPHVVTRFHPISQEYWSEIKAVRNAIRSPQLAHTYIFGSDLKGRASETEPNLKDPNTTAYIMPPIGDIIAAQEFISILKQKTDPKTPQEERDKPIIVINRGDFWKHLLWDICGDQYQNNQSNTVTINVGDASFDMYIEPNLDSAAKRLNDLAILLPEDTPYIHEKPIVPAGSTIFVATKTNEKIIELQKIFKDDDVKVVRLDHIANFKNPEEISGTFAGNAMEKIRNGREAFSQAMSANREHILGTFDRYGIDPKKIFLLAEDSGLYFENHHVLRHLDLKKLGVPKKVVFHNKHCPGVEFGPAINGLLGEKTFWEETNRVLDELEETKAYGSNLRSVVNPSVLALSELSIDPPKGKKHPVYFFSGAVAKTIVKQPAPADVEVPYTGNYLVPASQGLEERGGRVVASHKTQAELGEDYLAHFSPRTIAAKALKDACGVRSRGKQKTKSVKTEFNVATIGLSDKKEQTASLGELADWKNGEGLADKLEDIAAGHDAFVLQSHTAKNLAKSDHFFSDLFSFFSVIVAKQLTPRDKDKPFIINNKNQCWQPFLDLYNDMRRTAMASDQQGTFLKITDSQEVVDETLRIAHKNKFHGIYPEPHGDAMNIPQSGKCNVAVFCSATAKNQHLQDDAEDLGYFLGSNGYGAVYGAADREMMGAVRDGVLRAKKDGHDAWIAGSSTDDILQVESENPKAVIDSLDHYFNAKTIYQRMEYMFQTADIFTIIPGGAGTVQELAAVLMLKQQEHPSVRGKDVIIYNQQLQFGEKDQTVTSQNRFYDRLLTMIPESKREALGIHVCETLDEVKKTLETLRERGQEAPQTLTTEAILAGTERVGDRPNGLG